MIALSGGLGLGLSICRQLVDMHGGTLQASSVLGEGSVFTFTLPVAGDSFEEHTATTTALSLERNELAFRETSITMNAMMDTTIENNLTSYKPRILVVDDDSVNLRVITNILSEDG